MHFWIYYSHSTLIKNIAKKPKRTSKPTLSKNNSIEDIMGILDKRASSETADAQAVDKENSLQYNSQLSAPHEAAEANADADSSSATGTLSGNTVATIEHDLLDVEAAPAVVAGPSHTGIISDAE